MIGDRYNNWTIIGDADDRIDSSGKHHKRVLCKCDCERTIIEKDLYKLKTGAKMCRKCYLEILPNNGVPFEHKQNEYEFLEDVVVGHINNSDAVFYIDIDDYEKVKNYCWHLNGDGRVASTINGKHVVLSRYIMNCNDDKLVVDHIDRDPLNNIKYNLRICTQTDNTKNKSLYKNNKSGHNGVFYDKKGEVWRAYINCESKRYSLGQYKNKEEAIEVREKYEKELFGEFAPINN